MIGRDENHLEARAAALIVFTTYLFPAAWARAQEDKAVCPNLDPSASAAEQAVCWFDKDESEADLCSDEQSGVNSCVSHAVQWCADAALDDASVANACFLAYIRAGQFDEAVTMAEYLQSPSKQVERCREALSTVKARIVSIPASAEILVDDRSYGKAPVEVKLTGKWRENRIVARFGSGADAVEVVARPRQLTAVFDRRECVMGDVIIRGQKPITQTPPLLKKNSVSVDTHRGGISIPGLIVAGLGVAGIVTGGVLLAIAASRYSDLSDAKPNTEWTDEMQDDYDSLTPLRISGGVTTGAGSILALVGGLILLNELSERDGSRLSRVIINPVNNTMSMKWIF